jgi:hypothetical protein
VDGTPEASDQRWYADMQRGLRRFQDGGQTLHDLIVGLGAGLTHLQAADEAWKNEFTDLWSELEYIYADCVERQSGLTIEEFHAVRGVVDRLAAMLAAVRRWSALELKTLRAIINSRRPDVMRDIHLGLGESLAPKLIHEIRDALRDEIVENGTTDEKINGWGEACEDFMWRIDAQPPSEPRS